MRQHLARRDIQAVQDGELRGWRGVWVRGHLASCEACRRAVTMSQAQARWSSELLGALPRPVDLEESWARLAVRTGGAPLGRTPVRRVAWYVAGVGSGVAAAIALLLLAGRPDASRDAFLTLEPGEKVPTASDRLFVRRLHGLLADGEAYLIEDSCCADRDGEGPADDGTVLIGMRRSPIPIVVMYEDRDGSGSLTPGDIVRLVSRGSAPDRPPRAPGQS